MHSPNKVPQTRTERAHVTKVKLLSCGVCDEGGGEHAPSEAHELVQGLWFTTIPLCASCHRGPKMGLHGERRAWIIRKLTELDVLDNTIRPLFYDDAARRIG